MSLFNWNKTKKEAEAQSSAQPAYPPQPLNPAKTIRTVSPHGKVVTPHGTQVLGPQTSSSTQMLGGPRQVAFFQTSIGMSSDEPAVPPPEDKDIYLELGDIVERVPPGYLGDVTPHLKRRISFRLSEIFPDLAKGRATIPLSVLHSFCPEIFAQPVAPDDTTPIPLPLQKLVEQVGAFSQRPDQIQPEEVQQFDTPIAKVAAEDAGRLRPVKSETPPPPPAPKPATPPAQPEPAAPAAPAAPPADNQPPAAVAPAFPQPPAPPPPRPPQTVTPVVSAPIPFVRPQTQQAEAAPAPPAAPPPVAPLAPIRFDASPTIPSPLAAPASTTELPKRPPATVRASFAGGKITLRASPPPAEEGSNQASAPLQPLPAVSAPRPEPLLGSRAGGALQKNKATARIQLPPLKLQSSSAPTDPNVTKSAPDVAKLAPVAPKPVPFNISAPQPVLKTSPPDTLPPVAPVEKAKPPFIPSIPITPPAPAEPAAPPPKAEPAAPAPSAEAAASAPAAPLRIPAITIPAPASSPSPAPAPAAPPLIPVTAIAAPASTPPAAPAPAKARAGMVSISLEKILKALPPDLAAVAPSSVPDGACIQLETGMVEKQLSRGSVKLTGTEFVHALPADLQPAFSQIPAEASIALPLPEVFAALPQGALSMRRDQVTEQLTEVFDTPFSRKAEEDAAALGRGAAPPPAAQPATAAPPSPTPVSEAAPAPAHAAPEAKIAFSAPSTEPQPAAKETPGEKKPAEPEPAPEPAPVLKVAPVVAPPRLHPAQTSPEPSPDSPKSPAGERPKPVAARPLPQPPRQQAVTPLVPARPQKRAETQPPSDLSAQGFGDQTELQALFMTEEHLDAKAIVRHIARLPGIAGCHLMFSDGLPIAGNLPEGYNAEAFSALVPQFISRVEQAAKELALGEVSSATIYTDRAPVSFMASRGIGLAIVHSRDRYLPGVREKLMAIMKEIGRIYAPDKA